MNKKKIIAIVLLVVLFSFAAFAYGQWGPKAQAGLKTIAVDVIHGDQSVRSFSFETDAQTLGEVLRQESLASGEENAMGLYVKTVDGETVDESKSEWWNFSKDGEMLMSGVDDTMLADGDHYEITFTVGW